MTDSTRLERAKAYLSKLGMDGVPLAWNQTETLMEMFADRECAESDKRIAAELEQIVWATNNDERHGDIAEKCGDPCLVCDVNDKIAAFYDKLRNGQALEGDHASKDHPANVSTMTETT